MAGSSIPGCSSDLITLQVPLFQSAQFPVAPGWASPKSQHLSVLPIESTGSAGSAQPLSLEQGAELGKRKYRPPVFNFKPVRHGL